MSNGFRLRLRAAAERPLDFPLDLAGVLPTAMAGRTAAEVAASLIGCGNARLALGECFDVEPVASEGPELRFEGDLSRCDRIGEAMDGGVLHVEGDAGDYLGSQMRGGELRVAGAAGAFAGCEMAGGHLEIAGNVGSFAGGALPGSMDGMRGGVLVVHGHADARVADRMRRGTLVVHGDVGDFAASRMVAGTLALGGRVGAHCGYGMRRGTLVFAADPADQPSPPATFAPTGHDIRVIWALLARSLAYHGGRFATLPARQPRRFVGDLGADGKGEWLLPQA